MVRDSLLPALEVLLGTGSRDVVAAAVEAAGGSLLTVERRQVLYRPGEQASVRYAADVSWAGAEPVAETIVAVTTVSGPPPGTLVVAAGELAVGLFRYPDDPALPGLAVATSPAAVVDRLGIAAPGVRLTVRTYRPGRRAVVRAVDPAGAEPAASPGVGHGGRPAGVAGGAARERYLKVVPPDEAAALRDGLVALRRHLPVPEIAGSWPDLGIVALERLPGRTIRDVLLAGSRREVAALPDGGAILGLLARFPAPAPDAPRRRGPISRVAGHAGLLAAVLPAERERIAEIVRRAGPRPAGSALSAVHGDLHEAQLLVDGHGLSGILDLDDTGRGHLVDDLATMLGHLATLAVAVPRRQARIERYLARLRPSFERAADADELRRATAAAVLGLATGPFRVQQRDWRRRSRDRIALAEAWLAGR